MDGFNETAEETSSIRLAKELDAFIRGTPEHGTGQSVSVYVQELKQILLRHLPERS